MSVRRDVETVGTLCGADMESRSAALAIKQEVADGVFDVLLYGAFQSPCAILGIIAFAGNELEGLRSEVNVVARRCHAF